MPPQLLSWQSQSKSKTSQAPRLWHQSAAVKRQASGQARLRGDPACRADALLCVWQRATGAWGTLAAHGNIPFLSVRRRGIRCRHRLATRRRPITMVFFLLFRSAPRPRCAPSAISASNGTSQRVTSSGENSVVTWKFIDRSLHDRLS